MNVHYCTGIKNNVKEINIINRTYYFWDGIINIKNLDPYKIKTDEKPYKNILIHYVGYMTLNSVKGTLMEN